MFYEDEIGSVPGIYREYVPVRDVLRGGEECAGSHRPGDVLILRDDDACPCRSLHSALLLATDDTRRCEARHDAGE